MQPQTGSRCFRLTWSSQRLVADVGGSCGNAFGLRWVSLAVWCVHSLIFSSKYVADLATRWCAVRPPAPPSPCSGCLGGAAAPLGSPVSGLCALVGRRWCGDGSGGGWGASKALQMICWRRGRSGTEGGLWRAHGEQGGNREHGGSVLVLGGPAGLLKRCVLFVLSATHVSFCFVVVFAEFC